MWMLVALGAVHIAAIAIFVFEWVTPASYEREVSVVTGFTRRR